MSERRCFSAVVLGSDKYTEMSCKAQCLYVQLNLNADDNGFLNNAKRIARMYDFSEAEIKELLDNGYLIKFESGVYVITHWNVHNTLRKDRRGNNYPAEMKMLKEDESGAYFLKQTLSVSQEQETESAETTENTEESGTSNVEKAVETVENNEPVQTETAQTESVETVEKYFFDCWNNTKDKSGICIFPVGATVKDTHSWKNFWKNNKVTKEQIQTAFQNIADGLNRGALQRQYIPSSPDSFVSKNWIYKSQTRYTAQGENNQSEYGVDWTQVNF